MAWHPTPRNIHPMTTVIIPEMSPPNARVAEIISCSRGISGGCHGVPLSVSTNGMIACASGNRSIHHSYFTINVSSSHGDPTNSASAVIKLKTVYVGKTQYPISVIQLAEVLEISWKKKSGFDLLATSVGYLSGVHSVSYLIMLVDNKVPMYT